MVDMRKWIFFLSLIILGLSCKLNGQTDHAVSPGDFETLLQGTGSFQVLDVRTAEEFKTGYLKGALQANWLNKKEFADRTKHLDPAKPVYIYCASGVRSAEAAKVLRKKGYSVTELAGGMNAWKKENRSVEMVEEVRQMSNNDFQQLIGSAELVLVDAGAAWCPPCRKMEPILAQLEKDLPGKFKLAKIDAGIHTELMKQLKVDALPHFFIYKNGQLVWQQQGLVTLEELKSRL
jgi:rhodanese-related sulfurtransferase